MHNSIIEIKNYINNIGSNGFTFKVYDNSTSFFIINTNLYSKYKIKEMAFFLKKKISFFEFLVNNKKETFFFNFYYFFENNKNKILNMNKFKSINSHNKLKKNNSYKDIFSTITLFNNYIHSNYFITNFFNEYKKNIIFNIFFNI